MKPRIPLSVTVAFLAGISCLVTWMPFGTAWGDGTFKLGIPVWALFIGWAWYYYEGASAAVFKKVIPSAIPGAFTASAAVWALGVTANVYGTNYGLYMVVLMVIVALSVFALMLLLKLTKIFPSSLAAFNGYSSVFALTFIGGYPYAGATDVSPLVPLFFCFMWALIGNWLGPVFGWLSIALQFNKKVEGGAKEA